MASTTCSSAATHFTRLGYQRGTTDIDVVLRPTREQGERVKQALLLLPDKVSEKLMPE